MENEDEKIWKKWWVWIIIIVLFLIISSVKTDIPNKETNMNNNLQGSSTSITDVNQDSKQNITNIDKTQEVKYYEDNETINKYITLFNNMYPNNKITSDMLSVYHHHGTDHKDQVKFIMDDLEILLTANYKNSISVYIDNSKKDDITVKNLIKNFVKVFDSTITDEDIYQYIDTQGVGSNINTYDGIEYWTNKNSNGTQIIYIKITGKLK